MDTQVSTAGWAECHDGKVCVAKEATCHGLIHVDTRRIVQTWKQNNALC